jgi:hypothetical protein
MKTYNIMHVVAYSQNCVEPAASQHLAYSNFLMQPVESHYKAHHKALIL